MSNAVQMFHVIDDTHVIIRARGVFRQSKVYRRGKALYAAWGGGFIQLRGNSGTSHPNVSWKETDAPFTRGQFGHPVWNGE